jgi:DNA-directed RNA polymerase subunit alpha
MTKKIVLSFLTKKNENNLFLHCIDSRLEENGTWFSRFHLGPLYIGSRLQIGTRLRRTLLNDLNQTSITAIKLDGVKHEFSRISGTHESTLDLLFQFRKVALNAPYMKIGENVVVPFFFYGPGIFYAKDISWPNKIKCRNPITYLMSLSPGAIVRGRLLVKKKLRLRQNSKDLVSLGKTSPFESAISKKNDSKIPIFPWLRLGYPIRLVKRVGFRIESLEPINRQNEVLIIEVFTNGSISPREALNEASLLLTYKFSLITHLIIPTLNKNQYLIGKKINCNYSSKTFQNKVKKLIKTKKNINFFTNGYSYFQEPFNLDLGNLDLSKERYHELQSFGLKTLGQLLERLAFESYCFSSNLKKQRQESLFNLGFFSLSN